MKIDLSAADNIRSPIAEAFRSFRTNIQFFNVDKPIKSLVVTSSLPGEGKSTVAFNLAVSMAQTDKKVLLIDTDFRKPSLYSYMEPKGFNGLTNVIIQDTGYKDVLQTADSQKNLDIMISGPIPPNPSEILGSAKMRNLIEELEHEYDMIILDSPPVGIITDAAVLSTLVDGVIMVCAAGKTKKEDMKKSIDLLKKVRANIIGVVINKVKDRKKSDYYSYYRGKK